MYWSDWIHSPSANEAKIWRSRMDGSDVTEYVNLHLQWTNGLSLDIANDR